MYFILIVSNACPKCKKHWKGIGYKTVNRNLYINKPSIVLNFVCKRWNDIWMGELPLANKREYVTILC